MKERLSSGSYLHQKHLLYRGTTNKKVTSEQNINIAAVDPHWGQRRRGMKKMAQGQKKKKKKGVRSAEEDLYLYSALCISKFSNKSVFFPQKNNILILKNTKPEEFDDDGRGQTWEEERTNYLTK